MSNEVRKIQDLYKLVLEQSFGQTGQTPAPSPAPAAPNPPDKTMSTKAKVLSLPPGVSTRHYPVVVGQVYRIVDRQGDSITIVTPEHRKVILPKQYLQYV